MDEIKLTEAELAAKQYMIRMVKEATLKPCDVSGEDISACRLPTWYDEVKFKRGKQYFFDNRFGVLGSNLCGLITLLAEPKGLKILSSTGRSSTPQTAKKRYVSTILHVQSWYETDLSPGSKSWLSLNRVRRLHFNASKSATKKNIGYINQSEIALTTFGFMGYVIIRPHLLGIVHNNKDDREAFIHFWAVMGHMLGVEDQYNMCLFSVEIVEIICQIMLRYVFMPLIQFELPEFKQMVMAMCSGMEKFLPHMTYDIQMFTVKRIMGVPGYQFDVDIEKEKICRNIFTNSELVEMRDRIFELSNIKYMIFTEELPLININKNISIDLQKNNNHDKISETRDNMEDSENVRGQYKKLDINEMENGNDKRFNVDGTGYDVQLLYPDKEDWSTYLNDSKFYELSNNDQFIVKMRCRLGRWYESTVTRYLCESGLTVIIYLMRKWYNRTNKKHL